MQFLLHILMLFLCDRSTVKRIRDPESWDGGSSNFVQNLKANDGVPQALALQQHSGDAGAGSESAHGGPFVLQSVEFIGLCVDHALVAFSSIPLLISVPSVVFTVGSIACQRCVCL